MFCVAVGRVVVEHGRRPTGVGRHGFTDVSRQAQNTVAVVAWVGGDFGQRGHHDLGQILLLPTHGSGAEGLHVDPAVPLNHVARGGDLGSDGRQVGGAVPAQFDDAGVVLDDDVNPVFARPVRVLHPRRQGAFDTNDFVGVLNQVADFNNVRFPHDGIGVHAGHEQNCDAEHRPQSLPHHEVGGRAGFHHDRPLSGRRKSVPPVSILRG